MTAGLIVHWIAALLLIGMATYAFIEAKTSSLIPKALFLWPLFGALYGIFSLLSVFRMPNPILLSTGLIMLVCSAQAFFVNIRKLSRWPSGAVWLLFIVVALVHQVPFSGAEEPLFRTFYRRLSGFIWAAIGITKVISEKTVSQEGAIPNWITLLYIQAALTASFPS